MREKQRDACVFWRILLKKGLRYIISTILTAVIVLAACISPVCAAPEIDKDTVDFMPNYDDRLKEPEVLPVRFPQLLVNGSSGIAVGMATEIPPHNLGEVIDGMCCLIDNPDAELQALRDRFL